MKNRFRLILPQEFLSLLFREVVDYLQNWIKRISEHGEILH